MDIRKYTTLIIKRENEYLVGCILNSGGMTRWSNSAWDAWHTREWFDAQRVAKRVGGRIMLFNPVTGELREANKDGIIG